MVVTELAVTGLRCIEHAELEIPAGLAWVWGTPVRERLRCSR